MRAAADLARGWALLGVAALAMAGALALLLALSRTPGVQDWLPWDAGFFHRGLVTHVVFSFEIWLMAMLGALAASTGRRVPRAGLVLAAAGTVLLLLPTLANEGEASLNNYVPVLVHPLYYAGLAVFAAGIAVTVAAAGPPRWSDAPWLFGIRAAGMGTLAALACFALAPALLPRSLESAQYNERLFWAGGHVLQFVNTMLVMAAWHRLAELGLGRAPLPPATAKAAFAALLAACVAALPLMLRHELGSLEHRHAFTQMLWYALPLPPLAMGAGVAWALLRTRPDWRSPAVLGLALSLAVFALGGAAGFFLGVADTRTPSHYHAMIGGVNLALMGVMHAVLLPAMGRAPRPGRALVAQYHLYGFGQLLHAAGFFVAGASGVARKTAGAEQGLDSAVKLVSMGVVGLGGAVAVLGGVIFVWSALATLLRRETAHG